MLFVIMNLEQEEVMNNLVILLLLYYIPLLENLIKD